VFSVCAAGLIVLQLLRVLSGRLGEDALVMIKESEEQGELEALQAELARENAAGHSPPHWPMPMPTRPAAAHRHLSPDPTGDTHMTVLIFLGGLIGAMALGMPIAYALLASGVGLMWQLDLFDAQILAQNFINGADSFPLLAVPFFMLAGEIMNVGGLSQRIVNFALALVGHVKGGLGYVVILAACLLSSLSGSAVADAAALTALLLPMMVKAGHKKEVSGGLIAASGVIGPIIPPSIGFVIFGVAANVSISKLFIAGIFPGIMIGAGLALTWWWVGRKEQLALPRRRAAPRSARGARIGVGADPAGVHPGGPAHGRVHAHRGRRGGGGVLALRGQRDLPRAAAVGPAAHPDHGRQDHRGGDVPGGRGHGVVLADHGGQPAPNGRAAQALHGQPALLLVAIMVLVMLVGTAMDMTPTILIMTPVLMPVIKAAGIDPVYFGVLFIINNSIGLITPPVGTMLNVVAGVGPAEDGRVTRGVWPFMVAEFAVMFIMVLFRTVLAPLRWFTA
jgi:TRAP-type C4-dicarboxylate transport system permease large subunit